MAVGDDAKGAGYPLVPSSGSEEALVKWGAREINRTRDLVAQVRALILPIWPVTRGGTGGATKIDAKRGLGITYGTANPSGGSDGDMYFKVV